MKRLCWISMLLLVPFLRADSAPEEVAANVERRLRALTSISGDFEQLYYSMSVSAPLREKGRFYFQKPDWMKWEYGPPERNVWLYKDGIFLFYIPEENQLVRSRASQQLYESEILTIFSGRKDLKNDYLVETSPFPAWGKNVEQIKLTPRTEEECAYILLEVDGRTWLIRTAIFFDWAGNKQEFRFSRVKTDSRLSPDVFKLEVPPGCEIIEEDDVIKN